MRPGIPKHKGSTALVFLLLLSGLLTLSCGLLLYMERGRESLAVYEKGLQSVYAAESGANAGLARAARKPKDDWEKDLYPPGHHVKVIIKEVDGHREIRSDDMDGNGRPLRTVRIRYALPSAEGGNIKVEDIISDGHF